MNTNDLLLTFRFVERFTDVVLGGFAIYLGFKLFLHLPTQTNSEGKVILPGGVSIFLTRIGPGAFFALFGSIVLIYSIGLKSQLTLSPPAPDSLQAHTNIIGYSYSIPNKRISTEDERTLITMDLQTLSDVERRVNDMLSGKNLEQVIDNDLATRLHAAIPRLRAHLIVTKWNTKWTGDPKVFVDWVEKDDLSTVPEELVQPADYFQIKSITK
jgi:hypothetical protein